MSYCGPDTVIIYILYSMCLVLEDTKVALLNLEQPMGSTYQQPKSKRPRYFHHMPGPLSQPSIHGCSCEGSTWCLDARTIAGFTFIVFSFSHEPSAASHRVLNLLLGFSFKAFSSSNMRKRLTHKTCLRKDASIGLVKASASIVAVLIHLHMECSPDCSLSIITSMVVRHSWQFGTANFVIKSHRALQFVTSRAFGRLCNAFSGFCH